MEWNALQEGSFKGCHMDDSQDEMEQWNEVNPSKILVVKDFATKMRCCHESLQTGVLTQSSEQPFDIT